MQSAICGDSVATRIPDPRLLHFLQFRDSMSPASPLLACLFPTAARCSSARARSSWASSTSRPTRSPTADGTSISTRAVAAGAADGGRRRRPHRRRRRVDAARRRAGAGRRGAAPRAAGPRAAGAAGVASRLDRHLQGGGRRARPSTRGAAIVNDVSGLQVRSGAGRVSSRGRGAALVLMHTRGRSRDMYDEAVYDDVVARWPAELRGARSTRADAAGVRARRASSSIPASGLPNAPSTAMVVLARLPELAGARSAACSSAPRASRS